MLAASGELDRLAASIAQHVTQPDPVGYRRRANCLAGLAASVWASVGALGIGEVLTDLLDGHFGFPVERAVFVATLHRLSVQVGCPAPTG